MLHLVDNGYNMYYLFKFNVIHQMGYPPLSNVACWFKHWFKPFQSQPLNLEKVKDSISSYNYALKWITFGLFSTKIL